jgi:hypothetical protein
VSEVIGQLSTCSTLDGQEVLVVDRRGSLLSIRCNALVHLAKTCLECIITACWNGINWAGYCAVTVLITVCYVVFFPVLVTFEHLRRTATSLAEHDTTT